MLFRSLTAGLIGAAVGGLVGGVWRGIDAAVSGKADFWDAHVDLDLSKGYGASGGTIAMKYLRAIYTGKSFYGTRIYESSKLGSFAELWSKGVTLPEYGIVVGKGIYTKGYLQHGMFRTLLQHEYGHILQYQSMLSEAGGNVSSALDTYYNEIGKPSLWSASTSSAIDHANFSVELNANVRAKDFFGNLYINDPSFPLIGQPYHNPIDYIKNLNITLKNFLIPRF